jgi:hypothetical protein
LFPLRLRLERVPNVAETSLSVKVLTDSETAKVMVDVPPAEMLTEVAVIVIVGAVVSITILLESPRLFGLAGRVVEVMGLPDASVTVPTV